MKVSAKYLALRLPSKEKPTLDEFFLSLVDKSSTKCRLLKQRGAKEATTGTTKEICELFIKNWANQRPKNENKVTIDFSSSRYMHLSVENLFLEQNNR